jgi:hypothetical protein
MTSCALAVVAFTAVVPDAVGANVSLAVARASPLGRSNAVDPREGK